MSALRTRRAPFASLLSMNRDYRGQNVRVQSTEKAALRDTLRARRRERTDAAVAAARDGVRAAVLARCDERGWRCVAAYLPLRTEPGSLALLDDLAARRIRVLVPVLLPDDDLDWAQWDASAHGTGPALGVDAVGEADVVLAPALAVARDGTRLGRGGGSYDRALRRVRPSVPVAALLFDGELVDALPREEWDVRASAVVTPSGWQDLPGR